MLACYAPLTSAAYSPPLLASFSCFFLDDIVPVPHQSHLFPLNIVHWTSLSHSAPALNPPCCMSATPLRAVCEDSSPSMPSQPVCGSPVRPSDRSIPRQAVWGGARSTVCARTPTLLVYHPPRPIPPAGPKALIGGSTPPIPPYPTPTKPRRPKNLVYTPTNHPKDNWWKPDSF